mmetsp:Transcript_6828/g.11525  ORF Transcript_6828/g.11525 Transcript_6828/m.11525 type:complete len:400 (-) Transcript_6828:85-1284(-)
MVAHVLVDDAPSNVDRLVVLDLEQHLREALERLGELADTVVHEPQMEAAAHEVLLDAQGLLVHLDGQVDQVQVLPLASLVDQLGLALEGETLAVPELGVVGVDADGGVVVLVRQVELLLRLPVEEDVAPIEVDGRVVGVLLDGEVEVLLRLLELVEVVVCQASVVVVDARGLNSDGFAVVDEGLLELLVLEVGEAEIVVGRRLVVPHLDGLLEVVDRALEVANPSEAYSTVEEGLVSTVLLTRPEQIDGLLVVLDGLLHLVEPRLDQGTVVEVLPVLLVVVDGEVVVVQGFLQLPELVMLNSGVVVVLGECLGVFILLPGYPDCYREIEERPLKISHLVVALPSKREGLTHLPIFVTGEREVVECLLDVILILLVLLAVPNGFPGHVEELLSFNGWPHV